MSQQPLFTIIVSGYQNEPYLPQCLASIADQTFGAFEAICYVEESTDNSLAICQEWARRDSRFIVATGPKSGGGACTRNYGFIHAKGEYVVSVDGDDWLAAEMLDKLAAELNKIGSIDVLSFAALRTSPENKLTNAPKRITNFDASTAHKCFTGIEAIRRIWQHANSSVNAQTWLNIYRIDFLRKFNLYQLPNCIIDDFEWFPRVLFFAQKVAYLDEVCYHYRVRENSLITQHSNKIAFDCANLFTPFMAFIHANPIPEDIQAIWSNQWLWLFFQVVFYRSESCSDKEYKIILKIFFATHPKKTFWRFLLKTAWHRILALPLLWVAAYGWYFPANFYFKKIYPALDWRNRHCETP